MPVFKPAERVNQSTSSPETLAAFDTPADDVYRLGAGDRLTIEVWSHPELSGPQAIGPDGRVTIPVIGSIAIAGLPRDAAAGEIQKSLARFYPSPSVTIKVEAYVSNRIMVLGRVTFPGAITFDTPPTLLEVLARAAALPIGGTGSEKAGLTRCAIFRGRDRVAWINLKALMQGNDLSLNIRLRPGDLVYIPDSDDTMVYVLGAVYKPGAYRLTPNMSFLDALAQAGGPNRDATPGKIRLIRPGAGAGKEISFGDILAAKRNVDVSLEEGDILFVPESGLAKAGYILQQLNPGFSLLLTGKALNLIP